MNSNSFDYASVMFFLREKHNTYVNNVIERNRIGVFNRVRENKVMLLAMIMYLLETYTVNDRFNLNPLTGAEYNNILRYVQVTLNTELDLDFVELEAQYN